MLGCGYTDGRLAPRSVSAMLDEFLEAAYEALKAIGAQRHCDSDRAYIPRIGVGFQNMGLQVRIR